jgi:predicted nucleic acid-binding protein
MKFIDSNVLFRMFAVSPRRISEYQKSGSCGNNALDYAIGLLLQLDEGDYSTSEIAVLETSSVASRLGGAAKAETLLRAVTAQEGFRILETRAIAYPLAFTFVLRYQLEARDSLHLSVAAMNRVDALITSDQGFADGTALTVKEVSRHGFQLPTLIRVAYQLNDKVASLIQERTAQALSLLTVEQAPA